jgi:uncharacterized RDD family membrane protein YckC
VANEPGDRGLTPGDPLGSPGGASADRPAEPLHDGRGASFPGRPDEPRSPRPPIERPADASPWTEPDAASPPVWAPPFEAPSVASRGLVLAGWWRRVGAQLIDGAIITALTLVLFVPLGIGAFDDDPSVVALVLGFVVATLIAAVIAVFYAPFLMARTNGQTVGRMATGIRVVRSDGGSLTFGWAMLREVVIKYLLVGLASSITFGLASLLDVLWPLWDEENRALHDFLADTRVVRA